MDQITSFNIQIESLLKNKEAIQKDVENYEATRLVLVSQINILKEDKASNQNDDNVVELKILETMSNTLNSLSFTVNQENNPSDLLRKCRYFNRGHCKFKENCKYFHSSSICDMFLKDGICQENGCKQRHPKDCRYWISNIEGCNRKENCDYLHNNSKKFSETLTTSCYECNKCDYKTTDRDSFNQHIISCVYSRHTNDSDTENNSEDLIEDTNIKCSICEKLFKGKKGLKMHIARSRCRQSESDDTANLSNKNLSNSNKTYTCDQCDYLSSQQNEINEHISLIHKPLACDICELSCQNLTSLNVHKFNEHQPNDKTPTEKNDSIQNLNEVEGNFCCNQCNFKSHFTYNYMAHASYAHEDQEFLICDKCDYKTKVDNEFVSHLTLLHKKILPSLDD